MQQLMQDDDGNIWEVDANGEPKRLVQRARRAAPATITTQRDPLEISRERRAQSQDARAAAGDERAGRREDRDIEQRGRSNAIEDKKLDYSRDDYIARMRKEFDDRKEVQNFKTIAPLIGGTLRHAMDPKANGAGDLDMIYAFGKVMDPGSVVREGELALASNTGSFAQNMEAAYEKVKSGERLPPEVRRNLAQAMLRRGIELSRTYNQTRQTFEQYARMDGIDPFKVIGSHPAQPFQQIEADFTKQQHRNLDGSLGAAPRGAAGGSTGPSAPIGALATSFAPANVIDFAAGLNGGKYAFIKGGGLTYNGKEVPVSEAIANSEPYREAYRAQFGEYPPLTVDIEAGQVTPGAQSALDRRRDTFSGGVDAVGRGIADTLSVGLADPFAAAMDTLTGGGSFADNLIRERGVSAADERVNFGLRTAGQVAGGILPVMGATRLGAAALPSRPMLGAGIADTGLGAFYGGASNDKDRLYGAAVGGAAALAGNQFGQRVLAPAFRGVAGSPFGQRIGRGVATALDRPFTPPPVRPAAVDRAIAGSANANLDLIRSTLDDAERLGLPMALADTSPQLRTLAGSAVRRSPDARAFAEQALTPRSLGEGGRAIQAIRRDFGPAVNMRDERDSILGAGRAASAPLYDQSYGAPIVSTPELDAVLNTPFGQQAISRARTIAANERRDPTGAGFSLDADGNPVLNPIPINLYQRQAEARSAFDAAQEAHRVALRTKSADTNTTRQALVAAREAMQIADRALGSAPAAGTAATQRGYTTQTLDYAKRGMDDILESQRDPITGRLNLDEAGRAQSGVRSQLLAEMDRYNPFYRDARSTYQGYARQADALTSGYSATRPSVGVDDLNTMTARLGPEEQSRFGQGYSTGLTERIESQKFTGDPYKAIAGSLDEQAKLSALFPNGTPNFLRQSELERQMGLTKYEALGGSPTASRAQADRLLDPAFGVQALAETGLSMATGVPPIGAMAGAVRRGLGERFNVTMGQKKAAAIAPRLLAPDPAQARTELDAMVRANDAYNTYKRRTNGLLGMFGRGFGLPVGATFLAD